MIVIALLMCLHHSLVCVAMVMLPAKCSDAVACEAPR